MAGDVRDLGDGSYMVIVQLPAGKDPSIRLDVAADVLFSGRLSQLPKR